MPGADRAAATRQVSWPAAAALLALSLALRQDGPPPAGPSAVAAPQGLAEGELAWSALRGSLCSGANPVGMGLRGEYFELPGFRGQAGLVRNDRGIDFDDSLEWRPTAALRRPGSVRWTGWVKPPVSGRYRFHLGIADATVRVARQTVVAQGGSADVELAAGRYAPIVIEVPALPRHAAAGLRLEWTVPHGARFVVPRALLFPPSETVAGTGT